MGSVEVAAPRRVSGGDGVCTGVDADVPLQGARVGELALAVDADVGFLAAVDAEVALEVS